jgi:hypothetical protein
MASCSFSVPDDFKQVATLLRLGMVIGRQNS